MNRNLVLALILCSALAGCARPAPATTAAPTPAVWATLPRATTSAAAPLGTPSPTPSPVPTATATEAPTPTPALPITKGPMRVPPGVDTPIVIYTLAYEYARSGRPPGMDNPALGCAPFDESRPVIMLTVTLRVYNRSERTMSDWYAYFASPSGQHLYTCHRDVESLPALPPGYYVDVTFGAFIEGGMVRVHGYVFDRVLGRSNEVAF